MRAAGSLPRAALRLLLLALLSFGAGEATAFGAAVRWGRADLAEVCCCSDSVLSGEVPGTGAAVPEAAAVAPGTGAAVPGAGAVAPGTGAAVPEAGAVAPGTGAAVPEAEAVAPGTGAVVPKTGDESVGDATMHPVADPLEAAALGSTTQEPPGFDHRGNSAATGQESTGPGRHGSDEAGDLKCGAPGLPQMKRHPAPNREPASASPVDPFTTQHRLKQKTQWQWMEGRSRHHHHLACRSWIGHR